MWSFIGATHTAADTNSTVTRSVTAGRLLYVFAESNASGDTLSISDGVNTWFQVGNKFNDSGHNNTGYRWVAKAATTASITVTITTTALMESLAILEYSSDKGVPDDPRDVFAQTADPSHAGSTTTDADVTPTATPKGAGQLQISVIADIATAGDGTSKYNAGTGFTKRDEVAVNGRNYFAVQDKLAAGAGVQDAHWTGTVADDYFASNDFFLEAQTLIPEDVFPKKKLQEALEAEYIR